MSVQLGLMKDVSIDLTEAEVAIAEDKASYGPVAFRAPRIPGFDELVDLHFTLERRQGAWLVVRQETTPAR